MSVRLIEAVEVVLEGKKERPIMSSEERRIVSYHEVGHAGKRTCRKMPNRLQKITNCIHVRWEHLVMLCRLRGRKIPEYEKKNFEAMLVGLLAGRAAEEWYLIRLQQWLPMISRKQQALQEP